MHSKYIAFLLVAACLRCDEQTIEANKSEVNNSPEEVPNPTKENSAFTIKPPISLTGILKRFKRAMESSW